MIFATIGTQAPFDRFYLIQQANAISFCQFHLHNDHIYFLCTEIIDCLRLLIRSEYQFHSLLPRHHLTIYFTGAYIRFHEHDLYLIFHRNLTLPHDPCKSYSSVSSSSSSLSSTSVMNSREDTRLARIFAVARFSASLPSELQ